MTPTRQIDEVERGLRTRLERVQRPRSTPFSFGASGFRFQVSGF